MTKALNSKWWVIIAIGSGSFMAALDGSVVNTVLPVVRNAFQSDIATIQWVVIIYLLVLSGLLLTFGRLGDLRGHRSIYLWGYLIFVLSSALCGAAWSAPALVSFRASQAIGAAMLASNAPAIVTHVFPPEQRGRAFGLTSTMTYLGLTVGPSLGGWLTQSLGWRSVFFINIPVGLFAVVLGIIFVPKDNPKDAEGRFDLPGAVFFITGLTLLLLGLNKGAEWGWNSPAIIACLSSAVLILGIFYFIEKRSRSPILDLHLFKNLSFSAATLGAILNYICIFTINFLMPFYLIQGNGLNPAQAGLLLTAQPLLMAIFAPLSGILSDRIGSRWPGMLGMMILSGALFFLSRIGGTTTPGPIILGLAMAGMGTGIFITPNTSALMSSAPRSRQGIASGVQATARNLGMVLGIGLAGAIYSTQVAIDPVNGLYRGVALGFLCAAGIAFLGIIMSALKDR